MAESNSRLEVLIESRLAGRLTQDGHGSLSFDYFEGYDGPQLSLSMPLGSGPFANRVIRPYLFGLLPDERRERLAMGREHGVDRDNPFLLLQAMGWDCPGAVQFCREDEIEKLGERKGSLVPIDDSAIAEDLARITGSGSPSWNLAPERWSLGGMQEKIALAHLEGRWWRCEGSAATTHIIKPGVANYPLQALNEAFCLRLAGLCGIPASKVDYRRFGGIDAIVVERYDREVHGMEVVRLHQEDLCQSLGVMPESKYAEDHGPSAQDILGVLGANPGAQRNRLAFTAELFFNHLVGANDAHAKNYSVLLAESGPIMAPLYDCASGLPYGDQPLEKRTAAMRIGGEGHFLRVGPRHVARYAEAAGLDVEGCERMMEGLAERIVGHFDAALDSLRGERGEFSENVDELGHRLRDPMMRICENFLP